LVFVPILIAPLLFETFAASEASKAAIQLEYRDVSMCSWSIPFGLALLVLSNQLHAREKTDVIVLDNGDRLTGEIKRLYSGVLYFSVGYVDGTAEVQWSRIIRIESRQLFIVHTQQGSLYTGSLTTSTNMGSMPVLIRINQLSGAAVEMDRSAIVSLGQTSESFWRKFSGQIQTGLMQAKGNDTIQYSFASLIEHKRDRWDMRAAYASNLSSSTGSDVAIRHEINVQGYRFLFDSGRYFYAGLGRLLQSSVQNIERQGNLGAGLGRYLKNTDLTRVAVVGGLAVQRTIYGTNTSASSIQDVVAGLLYANASLFKFKKVTLTVDASLFPAISQPDRGRYYFSTNASLFFKIVGNLDWTASFYGNWDSRPPATLTGSDYGTSLGLNWTFGGK
jgi:hypothetical protein